MMNILNVFAVGFMAVCSIIYFVSSNMPGGFGYLCAAIWALNATVARWKDHD